MHLKFSQVQLLFLHCCKLSCGDCKLHLYKAFHLFKFKTWVQVVSRQKLDSNGENIVIYCVSLDVFSIAIAFLTTNDFDSGNWVIDFASILANSLIFCSMPRFFKDTSVQVVSHQKLNSNWENIVLYSINLDVCLPCNHI